MVHLKYYTILKRKISAVLTLEFVSILDGTNYLLREIVPEIAHIVGSIKSSSIGRHVKSSVSYVRYVTCFYKIKGIFLICIKIMWRKRDERV